MADTVKKTLGVNPVSKPIPIELSCDAMIVKALCIALPRELITNGHQVDSFEISGDAALVSQIALAFKAGQLSILINLS